MRENRNETDALNESESSSVQRGLLYARLSSVSPGRESTDDALSSSILEELLSRALMQGDQDTWVELQQGLNETLYRWLHTHPSKDTASLFESEEHYLTVAFEQFRQAAIEKSMAFNTLAEVLVYLRASLNGAILETLRACSSPKAVSLTEPEESKEANEEDDSMSLDVWNRLQVVLSGERQLQLAYLLYQCGLSPREIVCSCSQELSDVQEIYRLRRNLLNLFVHNTNELS
jgi:hypothetical protein